MKKKLMIHLYVVVDEDDEELVKDQLEESIDQIPEIGHWDFTDTEEEQ